MIEFYQVSAHSKKISFSPFVIATELFLKHKNLKWDAKLMNYSEVKSTVNSVTNGEWGLVPTLKFPNGDLSFDSLKIADYLDTNYPDNPINFNNPKLDDLIDNYNMNCAIISCKLSFKDLLSYMDDSSQEYFINNRMPMLKTKLEDLEGNREESIANYFDHLNPLIEHLNNNKFIDGDKPLIHDYNLISSIQFIKTVSPKTYKELIENNPNEVFKTWVNNMGNLFNGFLNNRKTILSD